VVESEKRWSQVKKDLAASPKTHVGRAARRQESKEGGKKTEVVIMCCLVGTIPDLSECWYMSM
jgi:hypothetical protein